MRAVFAGGGTGGHLFPGLAVAELLRDKITGLEIVFIGTGRRGLEKRVIQEGFDFRSIHAVGLAGGGLWKKMKGVYPLVKAVFQSIGLLRELKPYMVFGLGGYSSGPVGLAAGLLGVPLFIHEQNMIPGLTNRFLGRIARIVFISFEKTADYFPQDKTLLVGNPLRSDLLNVQPRKANGKFSLLVMGGSQGSQFINHTIVKALGMLGDLKDELSILHQTGEGEYGEVRSHYGDLPFKAAVRPFIEDMGGAYAEADLIVARAGATTIAEITALKKAAVFIPYPFAANNHQEMNARFLEEKGAGKVLLESDLTPEVLAMTIREYYEHPEELALMRKRAGALGRTDASYRITEALQEYLNDLR